MIVIDCEQGSDQWHAARLGKVTASRMGDLTAKTAKGAHGASRANYAAELVAERLTGVASERFTNAAMQWGTEREPEARAMYEFMRDATVTLVGIVRHPVIVDSLASPDGLVGDDGLIEIKCPSVATHISTLLGDPIDGKYVKQMQWQMACTGRRWCDFASFDPRLPAEMQLHVRRVERDDAMIEHLQEEVVRFLSEVDETVCQLRAKYQMRDAV